MLKCLSKCGGMMRQFLIDDKGCVFIGLWGVPTANHANNCCLALRCSVLMQTEAHQLGEVVSIGIATGSVYTGLIGPTERQDYVALGHSVNLSARLMCKADGQILFDGSTYERLPFSLHSTIFKVENCKLNGVPSGTVYWYSGDHPIFEHLSDVREERMIVVEDYVRKKRDEIIDVLGSTLQRIPKLDVTQVDYHTKCFSRVVMIEGGFGSGKSTIFNYFLQSSSIKFPWLRSIDTHQSPILYFTLSPSLSTFPFEPIKSILSKVLAPHGSQNFEAILQNYLRKSFPALQSDTIGADIFPKLRQCLLLESCWNFCEVFCQNEDIFSVEVSEILSQLLSCIFVTEGIKILALEDAHFLSSECWKVLHSYCKLDSSTFVIMTVCREVDCPPSAHSLTNSNVTLSQVTQLTGHNENRTRSALSISNASRRIRSKIFPDDQKLISLPQSKRFSPEYYHFVEDICPNILQLRPMTHDTLSKIIEKQEDLHHQITLEMTDIIFEICQGNPSVFWRIINHFKENMTRVDMDQMTATLLDNSLVVSLMESCPHLHTVVLKVASVIGEEFSVNILKSILPVPIQDLVSESLYLLVEKGFIKLLTDEFYCFTSTLIWRMVYDLIPLR
jgi:hypothetical protein